MRNCVIVAASSMMLMFASAPAVAKPLPASWGPWGTNAGLPNGTVPGTNAGLPNGTVPGTNAGLPGGSVPGTSPVPGTNPFGSAAQARQEAAAARAQARAAAAAARASARSVRRGR
jgi:hypothetical protein